MVMIKIISRLVKPKLVETVEPTVETVDETVEVYASFPNNRSTIIQVDSDGAAHAVEGFYEIGAVFAAVVK
jgi:hypothetical protein